NSTFALCGGRGWRVSCSHHPLVWGQCLPTVWSSSCRRVTTSRGISFPDMPFRPSRICCRRMRTPLRWSSIRSIGVGSIVITTVSRRGTTPASRDESGKLSGSGRPLSERPPSDPQLDPRGPTDTVGPFSCPHHVWCVPSGHQPPYSLSSPLVVLVGGRSRHTNDGTTPHSPIGDTHV